MREREIPAISSQDIEFLKLIAFAQRQENLMRLVNSYKNAYIHAMDSNLSINNSAVRRAKALVYSDLTALGICGNNNRSMLLAHWQFEAMEKRGKTPSYGHIAQKPLSHSERVEIERSEMQLRAATEVRP